MITLLVILKDGRGIIYLHWRKDPEKEQDFINNFL